MSKYEPLTYFLSSSGQHDLHMAFSEIEDVLGFELPDSARKFTAWWSNSNLHHGHANSWMSASYKTTQVDLCSCSVCFQKCLTQTPLQTNHQHSISDRTIIQNNSNTYITHASQTITVQGYDFVFLQQLIPQCNDDGALIMDHPSKRYAKKDTAILLPYGDGSFCRFSIDSHNRSGVYLWIVDNRIIYIGETSDLKRRFNSGYGYISPRNCFKGGQNTNCKMNKVVLNLYKQGKAISIYFHETKEYKVLERDLLEKIKTPYNSKNNVQR